MLSHQHIQLIDLLSGMNDIRNIKHLVKAATSIIQLLKNGFSTHSEPEGMLSVRESAGTQSPRRLRVPHSRPYAEVASKARSAVGWLEQSWTATHRLPGSAASQHSPGNQADPRPPQGQLSKWLNVSASPLKSSNPWGGRCNGKHVSPALAPLMHIGLCPGSSSSHLACC